MPAATPPNTTFGYAAEERLPRSGIGVPFDRTRASESSRPNIAARSAKGETTRTPALVGPLDAASRKPPCAAVRTVTTRSCVAPAHRCNGERGIPGYPSKRPRDSLGRYVRVEQQHLTIGPPAGRALPCRGAGILAPTAYGSDMRAQVRPAAPSPKFVRTSSEPAAVQSLCSSWRSGSRPSGSRDHPALCDPHNPGVTSVATPARREPRPRAHLPPVRTCVRAIAVVPAAAWAEAQCPLPPSDERGWSTLVRRCRFARRQRLLGCGSRGGAWRECWRRG
jgi:hypothetical protein